MKSTHVIGSFDKIDTSILFTLVYSCYSIFLKKLTHFMVRFIYHPIFIFIIYNIIYRCKAVLGYSLLIKSDI